MIYRLCRMFARIALRWYYSEIRVVGLETFPTTGCVLIVANHPNALVDALVIACSIPARITLTAKATLFETPLAGWFFRTVGIIPLRRLADERPGIAGSHRNAEAFQKVIESLDGGGFVLIFPEGKSHNSPSLAPLRTGAARITIQARQEQGLAHLRIVPIGLTFEQKERPRSRVLVSIGASVLLPAGDEESLSLQIERLTQQFDSALRAHTLNFASSEAEEEVAVVTRVLAAANHSPSLNVGTPFEDDVALIRRVSQVRSSLETNVFSESVIAFQNRVRAFDATLRSYGVLPQDLSIDLGTGAAFRFIGRVIGQLVLTAPLAWWGRLNHFIPLRLARRIAIGSSTSRDEPAMRSILFGILLVLAFYATIGIVLAITVSPWVAAVYLLSLPPSASWDLTHADRWRRALVRVRAFLFLRRHSAIRAQLLKEAHQLVAVATAIEQGVLLPQAQGVE